MRELAWLLIGKLVEAVPAILLRLVLPPRKIAGQVRLGLREEAPITVELGAEVPRLRLYLDITNLSPLELTLDRLLVELWFGQPTLQGAILRRWALPSRKVTSGVHFGSELTAAQAAQIKGFLAAQGSQGRIMIHLVAYCVSKVGVVEVKRDIERGTL